MKSIGCESGRSLSNAMVLSLLSVMYSNNWRVFFFFFYIYTFAPFSYLQSYGTLFKGLCSTRVNATWQLCRPLHGSAIMR